MKIFHCCCGDANKLFFESVSCVACQRLTGFDPESCEIVAFDPASEAGLWQVANDAPEQQPRLFRQCDNYVTHQACNWMVAADDPNPLCRACRLNEVIPDLTAANNLERWRKLEIAKRRTLYTALTLGLPVTDDDTPRLIFCFMADRDPDSEFTEPLPDQEPVFTGHDSGKITVNLAEADDIARIRVQRQLGERYRTLLGHFRHEIGHYYWDVLVSQDEKQLARFRELFGDDRIDYQEAMNAHYENGPSADWPETFISAYATMHPWEDWAESWAHYFHMIDTLETGQALQLSIAGRALGSSPLPSDGVAAPFSALLENWIELSIAMNSLNRSMGLSDAYPFVLNDAVQQKLKLVHELIQGVSRSPSP